MTETELNELQSLDLSTLELSDEEIKSLGYDSLEELTNTINKSVENYKIALQSTSDNLSTTAKESFNSLFGENSVLKNHLA